MTAAMLTTAAYVAAWAAFFGYECVVEVLPARSRRTPIVAAIVTVITTALPAFGTPFFGLWIPIVAFGSAAMIRCLTYDLRVWLPWVASIFPIVIFVYPTVAGALKGIDLYPMYFDTVTLAILHVSLILLLIGLNLMLWFRALQRVLPALTFAAVASLVSLACIIPAVLLTFPRGGDEGVLAWIYIIPGLLITGVSLLLISFAVLLLSVVFRLDARYSQRGHPPRSERPPQPVHRVRQARPARPAPAAAATVFASDEMDIELDLFDCPHCQTFGVLRTSDGRCPNCKTLLEDSCRQ
jgi:hypothetical protein